MTRLAPLLLCLAVLALPGAALANEPAPAGADGGHAVPDGHDAPAGSHDTAEGHDAPADGHGTAEGHDTPADGQAKAEGHDAPAESHEAPADGHGAAEGHDAPADGHGTTEGHDAPADGQAKAEGHDAPAEGHGTADGHDAPADGHGATDAHGTTEGHDAPAEGHGEDGEAIAAMPMPLGARAVTAEGIEAEGMMRALHLVQDELARGDVTTLPMQQELIGRLPALLAAVPVNEGVARDALIIGFALDGAPPKSALRLLSTVPESSPYHALAMAVAAYVGGRPEEARSGFAKIDPRDVEPRLAPYVALARATVHLGGDVLLATGDFDLAALMAPGTLIEEVALRRLMVIGAEQGDKERFLRSANLYARRYMASPFAGQFAAAFTAGLAEAMAIEDLPRAAAVMDGTEPAERDALYLAAAGRLALDGKLDAVKEMARLYFLVPVEPRSAPAQRMTLYQHVAELKLGDIDAAAAALQGIDRKALRQQELDLLDAALSIAGTVMAPLADLPAGDETAAVAGEAPVAGPKPDEAPAGAAGEAPVTAAATAAEPPPTAVDEGMTAIDAALGEARKSIEDLDRLMKETSE